MESLDFSRSFVTFFTTPAQGGNIARIQIDATCRVDGWGPDGGVGEFHLITPCRSEVMYEEGQLFQMPNYEFCGIFAATELVLLRTHWTSEREEPEHAYSHERFERVSIDLTPMPAASLVTDREVVEATLANRRLAARTELIDPMSGAKAVIDYPVKTMNVRRDPANFQVDTGPILVPRWDAADKPAPLRFDIAHIVYWQRDRAELVLRRPLTIGEESAGLIQTTDYSELRFENAVNSILGEAE